ncbi:MAG: hypothetical protein OEV78_09285 [Spirochaetia bacterium]|nr:hypothetical protein [Spirochaetia bacterium]
MKKRMTVFLFLLISSSSLFSDEVPAYREDKPDEYSEAGYHEHDDFYIRFYLNPSEGQ